MILDIRIAYLHLAIIVLAETVPLFEKPSVFGYHKRFGIPKARKIQKWEENHVGLPDSYRIIGGWHVNINQLPYQAGLVIQINWIYQSVCGASLISQARLVTAAHCKDDGIYIANSFTVVLGSSFLFSGGLRILTTDIVMHPSWDPSTLEADIAVIRIPSISYSNVIQPISLPSGNELLWTFEGTIATASGFGLTSDEGEISQAQSLSAVNVPVISNVDCRSFFGIWIHNSNICTSGAGYIGVCGGDSGGPLAVTIDGRNTLIGVASFVSWFGCEAGDPSAFARVTSYVNWIRII